jgi:hypothetical protein
MFVALATPELLTTKLTILDRTWSQLASDAFHRDATAFEKDRQVISQLYKIEMIRWGARLHETYEGPNYSVVTYDGPTHLSGYRWKAAYFAIVTPRADFAQPTLWEMYPADKMYQGKAWGLTVNGCDLITGESLAGHPKYWRSLTGVSRPSYQEFKAEISNIIKQGNEFPDDTTRSQTVGAACVYVGGVSDAIILHSVARSAN